MKTKAIIADIPGLKFCHAFGETPDEVLKIIIEVKTAWLESAKKNKEDLKAFIHKNLMF